MVYWIIHYLLIISLLILYLFFKNKIFIWLVAFTFSIFSGFRPGLGQDYENYLYVIINIGREYSLDEPLYTLFIKIAQSNFFTPVIFFVITSIFINFLVISSYSKYKYYTFAILFYFINPLLYFNSFNIVRQFLAASIILFGLKFIINNKPYKYAAVVLLATGFHVSSLIGLVLYPMRYFSINKVVLLIILTICLSFSSIFKDADFFFYELGHFRYLSYLVDDSEKYNHGFFFAFLCFTFLYILIFGDINNFKMRDKILLFAFFLLIIIYSLIPINVNIFRLSIIYILYLPLVISLPMKKKYSLILAMFLMITSLILFINLLNEGYDNPKIVPQDYGVFSFS